MPLRYRRAPLGFLLLDKSDWQPAEFARELFFLQTIQTVLTEEVANAVHLSRLVDLKNFNAAVLERVESGVLTANASGEVTFMNRLARQTIGLQADVEPLYIKVLPQSDGWNGVMDYDSTDGSEYTIVSFAKGGAAGAQTGDEGRDDRSRERADVTRVEVAGRVDLDAVAVIEEPAEERRDDRVAQSHGQADVVEVFCGHLISSVSWCDPAMG